jgi:hypothetical protein
MNVNPQESIKIGPRSIEELVEGIEGILGDDIWGMRGDTGGPGPNMLGAVYAIITFDGNECRCCGNQGGTVTFFGLDDRETWSFDFSD